MGKLTADIKFIGELDFSQFDIPYYQRPYRWERGHVETLLDCIYINMDKSEYRIGSIIANPHNGKLDIVDGQQRITTLSLLFTCLDPDTSYKVDCGYSHIESKLNIYNNYRIIQHWLEINNVDKEAFKDFVLTKCSVVFIVIEDLMEAFQMFDSQNGRGKELEAYNLLKAFHLRAIDKKNNLIVKDPAKIKLDQQWEGAAIRKTAGDNEPLLKFLVNDLYRSRIWSRSQTAFDFSKRKVKEFKGIQIDDNKAALPLHNLSLLIYLHFKNTDGAAKRNNRIEAEAQNPFVTLNMDIINGELFFVYVHTFVSAYEYLFKTEFQEDDLLYDFGKHFKDYCLGYCGAWRTGDKYIRDTYIALIIALYDRFGEEYVAKYFNVIYSLIYRKRLEQKAVYYETMASAPLDLFSVINSAVDYQDLNRINRMASEAIRCRKLSDKEADIARFILEACPGTKIECAEDEITLGGFSFHNGDVITRDKI